MNFERFATMGFVVWALVVIFYLLFCICEHTGTKYFPYPEARRWAKPGIFVLKWLGCAILAVIAASMMSAVWVAICGVPK